MSDDSITTADLVYERDTTISERVTEALAAAGRSGMTMDQLEAALPSNRPGAIPTKQPLARHGIQLLTHY